VPDNQNQLDDLVPAVRANPRYRNIDEGLVRSIGGRELLKRRNLKEAVKATRNKLHQVGGAYQETAINYEVFSKTLKNLPAQRQDEEVKSFCKDVMQQHASTRERLPILEDFFSTTLAPIGPIHSILDLACGLNPLALPWMPLAENIEYHACDIYQDMVGFINSFFKQINILGNAELFDLTAGCPDYPVQVALLLKTLPCLEQLDKTIGMRLINSIHAEHILVSYPGRSLAGQAKGMVQFYEDQFLKMVEKGKWEVQRYEFPNELAFRLDRVIAR
jgi:16S rRNA (guanine(1405)-N(7))-methyltransferase